METKDYYRILSVPQSATEQEIHKAYRLLARKFHPDVNPAANATERMAELNTAYGVLRDPQKRRLYDRRRGSHDCADGSSQRAREAEAYRRQQDRARERSRQQRQDAARKQSAEDGKFATQPLTQAGEKPGAQSRPVSTPPMAPLPESFTGSLGQIFNEVQQIYENNHHLSAHQARLVTLLMFLLCGFIFVTLTLLPFVIWHVTF